MGDYVVSARKYRPDTFEDVVGQEHVTSTLQNALASQKLAQTLLFCGPRGVGKTSCARIVARMVNGYSNDDVNPIDIFELDAASNNSVDDIRHLTEQVRYPPQAGKYKVYIIDEVHMLSNAAFNAFLKTLEEPPRYAIFILATTEKHKVIPTVLSRCQIFDFNRIQAQDIVMQLKRVAERENIRAEEGALYLIAQKADGAMRDALSMFDLMTSFAGAEGTITLQSALVNLRMLDYDYYFKVVDALLRGSHTTPLLLFDEAVRKGFDGRQFIVGLSNHIRNLMVCRDLRTMALAEIPENVKKKYLEQAASTPTSLLLSWLSIANQCDIHYRESKNQRLSVELALMKMAHVNALLSKAPPPSAPAIEDVKKKTESVAQEDAKPLPDRLTIATSKPNAQPASQPWQSEFAHVSQPAGEKVTPSLKSLSVTPKYSTPAAPPPAEGEQPIAQLELEQAWSEFVETRHSSRVEQQMLRRPFELQDSTITLKLSNALEEPALQGLKVELTDFLRKQLNNRNIDVHGVVSEEQPAQKVAYTGQEKFAALAESYPLLNQLKDRLGLDVDY